MYARTYVRVSANSMSQISDRWEPGYDTKHLHRAHRFDRSTTFPHLWDYERSTTNVIGDVCLPGGRKVQVYCTRDFEFLLFGNRWAREVLAPEPAMALKRTFELLVPRGADMLMRRYTTTVWLERAEFQGHKAFVMGVILFSKWLCDGVFPVGVRRWPPPLPALPDLAAVVDIV